MDHGRDFAATVARSVGGSEWSDIISGIDLLIAEGVADPDRLGIGGAGHGGFMAARAIGQSGRLKAAMMTAGISDRGMLVAAEHEPVIYPREGHGFAERNHQLDLLWRTRAWFDRRLRGETSDGRGSPA